MNESSIKPTLGLHETGIVVWNNKPMDDVRGQLRFTSQAVLQLSAGHKDEPCRLTQVADPIDDSDAIPKRHLDSVVGTINPTTLLSPCRVATTTELWSIADTLRPGYYIDGVRLLDGDRVLVKDQHPTLHNGVYTVGVNAPSRSADAEVGVLLQGLYCFVKDGEQHANQSFICVSAGEFGSHNVLFRPLSGSIDAPMAVSVIQPKLQSLGVSTTTVMQHAFCETLHVNTIKGIGFGETPTSVVSVDHMKQALRNHIAVKPPVDAVTTEPVCIHDARLHPQRPAAMTIDDIPMDDTTVDQLTHALGTPLPSIDGGSIEQIPFRTATSRDAITTVRVVHDLGQPVVLQGLKIAVRTSSYSNEEYTCTLSVYGSNNFDVTDGSDVCIARLRGIQHLTSRTVEENFHQGYYSLDFEQADVSILDRQTGWAVESYRCSDEWSRWHRVDWDDTDTLVGQAHRYYAFILSVEYHDTESVLPPGYIEVLQLCPLIRTVKNPLQAGDIVGGIQLEEGWRVLVNEQVNPFENGIWVVQMKRPPYWSRERTEPGTLLVATRGGTDDDEMNHSLLVCHTVATSFRTVIPWLPKPVQFKLVQGTSMPELKVGQGLRLSNTTGILEIDIDAHSLTFDDNERLTISPNRFIQADKSNWFTKTNIFTDGSQFEGPVRITSQLESTGPQTGSLQIEGGLGVTGAIFSGMGLYTQSDARCKSNISLLSGALDVVCGIRGYEYDLAASGHKSVGVLAQEVQRVAPRCVCSSKAGNLSVDYTKLVPYLIECIRSLNTRLEMAGI